MDKKNWLALPWRELNFISEVEVSSARHNLGGGEANGKNSEYPFSCSLFLESKHTPVHLLVSEPCDIYQIISQSTVLDGRSTFLQLSDMYEVPFSVIWGSH